MKHALFRWFALTIAVWVAVVIVPGISCESWRSLFVAALILGILNSFVKPVLQLLSFPFIILSVGFFLLVINAILLGLAALLTPGFYVYGFWSAVGGSLVISIVSMFLGYSRQNRRIVVDRIGSADTLSSGRRGPPPGKGPIIDV